MLTLRGFRFIMDIDIYGIYQSGEYNALCTWVALRLQEFEEDSFDELLERVLENFVLHALGRIFVRSHNCWISPQDIVGVNVEHNVLVVNTKRYLGLPEDRSN